jgi:hypothetical protein
MTDNIENNNYMLDERLKLLPVNVFNQIRDDFLSLPKTTRQRWYQVRKGKIYDIRAREALVITERIGCTLSELLNPSIDLQSIYLERVQKQEQDDFAASIGLQEY